MKSYPASLNFLVCFLIICATCGLSCRRKTPETEPAPAPNETTVEAVVDETGPNSVAVIVDDVKITEGEVDKMIEPQLTGMMRNAPNRPPEFINQMRKMLRQRALEQMIFEQLMEEKTKEANIVITEEEVISQIGEIASMQRPPVSVEDFKKKMGGLGKSFDEVKQQVRKGLVYQKIMEAQFADKINITEDEAKNYYNQYLNRYKTPEQVKASHILIKPDTSDPNTDPNEAKAIAKTKAEELLKQIKAGADFAELAKANSDCPSAARGGDLDFFGRRRMVPPFEKVAFELEVGQISDIVETKYGYHIIKVTDHKDAGITTFEQAKDDIMKRLTQRRQRELAAKYIESLKAEANIVYPPGKEPKPIVPPTRPSPPPRQEKPLEPHSEGRDEPQDKPEIKEQPTR